LGIEKSASDVDHDALIRVMVSRKQKAEEEDDDDYFGSRT
jgi:hypothetical protein